MPTPSSAHSGDVSGDPAPMKILSRNDWKGRGRSWTFGCLTWSPSYSQMPLSRVDIRHRISSTESALLSA
jgi:hypothetical protein